MQTSDHTPYRPRVIVLYEIDWQAVRRELILSKRLHEKSSGILKHFRNKHHNIAQESRLDFNFHRFRIPSHDSRNPMSCPRKDRACTITVWLIEPLLM